MNKNIFSKWFSLIAAALLLASCGGGRTNNAEETAATEEPDRPRVRVEEVRMRPVEQQQTFTATVQAETVNNIAPGIPARIRRILVDVGATVRRGQTLVELDATNLSQQQIQLENLRRDFARFEELYAVGGISRQQLDQMRAQLDIATSAHSNLAENTTLVSPINGVVTARNFDPGDMPAGMPILTIQSINRVKVLINIPESNLTRVERGMSVEVRFDAFGDEAFAGQVTLIHPTIDPISRTFTAEITLPNADMRIRPGMFARVSLNFGEVERVVIPDRSVVRQPGTGDRYVFTLNADNTVSYTQVILGSRMGSEFEVISGLETGERVVVSGLTGLIDGMEVEPIDN